MFLKAACCVFVYFQSYRLVQFMSNIMGNIGSLSFGGTEMAREHTFTGVKCVAILSQILV